MRNTEWVIIQKKSNSPYAIMRRQRYYHVLNHANGQTIYTSELTSKVNMETVSERIFNDLDRAALVLLSGDKRYK